MAPSRPGTRPLVLAVVLGLVAVLGVVWLVRTATIDGENTSGEKSTSSAEATDGSDPTGGDTPEDGGRDGSASAGQTKATAGSGTPSDGGRTDGGRRSIQVNGVRLDGARNDPGCLTVINKTATAGTIENVSFVVVGGPARPAVSSDNAAHCDKTGDPPCRGVRLVEGGQCLAGAVLAANAPQGTYTVEAVVHYSYLCDNTENAPCTREEIPDWGGPPPTPQSPVLVRGTSSTNVPRLTMVVGDTDDDTSEEDSPTPSETTTSTPSPQDTPPTSPEEDPLDDLELD
ncbi:hypothetical protein [Streptomyces sp. NPDC018693]|uniref:hypothetical protein n=1 Tax=unclassified Streptomyces TaxID=2593676 RepID=UPI003787EEA1